MRNTPFSLMLAFSLWFAAGTGVAVYPQTDDPSEVLFVETQLVEVPVLVSDPNGKPVLDLKPDNFVVFEDGRIQEIAGFRSTNAPFEVALLLDTSGSTRADLNLIRRAAEHFLDSLRPGDRVSIVAFNSTVRDGQTLTFAEVVSDLTEDRSELTRALAKIGTSNGTPFYDSIIHAIDVVFRHPTDAEYRGRRALVALTDGVDSTSDYGFEEAKSIVRRSGVVSYFIRIDTRLAFEENLLGDCSTATHFSTAQIRRYYDTFPKGSKMEKVFDFCKIGDFSRLDISRRLYQIAEHEMNELASLSGGRVFSVSDIKGASEAFGMVAGEIGTKYSLGYYSTNESRDGKYRSIRVELIGLPEGTQVRARAGYSAPSN